MVLWVLRIAVTMISVVSSTALSPILVVFDKGVLPLSRPFIVLPMLQRAITWCNLIRGILLPVIIWYKRPSIVSWAGWISLSATKCFANRADLFGRVEILKDDPEVVFPFLGTVQLIRYIGIAG
jgi:hypothetical protein